MKGSKFTDYVYVLYFKYTHARRRSFVIYDLFSNIHIVLIYIYTWHIIRVNNVYVCEEKKKTTLIRSEGFCIFTYFILYIINKMEKKTDVDIATIMIAYTADQACQSHMCVSYTLCIGIPIQVYL